MKRVFPRKKIQTNKTDSRKIKTRYSETTEKAIYKFTVIKLPRVHGFKNWFYLILKARSFSCNYKAAKMTAEGRNFGHSLS